MTYIFHPFKMGFIDRLRFYNKSTFFPKDIDDNLFS
jgi:hypothetical protein